MDKWIMVDAFKKIKSPDDGTRMVAVTLVGEAIDDIRNRKPIEELNFFDGWDERERDCYIMHLNWKAVDILEDLAHKKGYDPIKASALREYLARTVDVDVGALDAYVFLQYGMGRVIVEYFGIEDEVREILVDNFDKLFFGRKGVKFCEPLVLYELQQ